MKSSLDTERTNESYRRKSLMSTWILQSTDIPRKKATWLQEWSFSWLNPLFSLGARQPLEMDDLFVIPSELTSQLLAQRISECWEQESNHAKQKGTQPSLQRALWNEFAIELIPAAICRFWSDSCLILSPLLLKYLVSYLGQPSPVPWVGFLMALGLFLSALCSTLFGNQHVQLATKTGIKVRVGLTASICRKALYLAFKARQTYDSSKVVSMVATDCQRVEAFLAVIHVLWAAPFQIIITVGLLAAYIGVSCVPGLVIIVLVGPAQGRISNILRKVRQSVAPITDKRVKIYGDSYYQVFYMGKSFFRTSPGDS